MVLKVKKGVVSERKDDRIKAIRNLEKILAEPTDGPDDYMSCDYCDNWSSHPDLKAFQMNLGVYNSDYDGDSRFVDNVRGLDDSRLLDAAETLVTLQTSGRKFIFLDFSEHDFYRPRIWIQQSTFLFKLW